MQTIPRRLLLISLLLVGLFWIWMSRLSPSESAAAQASAPAPGFLAPEISLENLAGSTVTLSSLRGQPVVINFWASWCPPCRAEMPALQTVQEAYAGRVVLLAVNATSQDSLENARAFLQEQGLNLNVLLDIDGAAQRQYAITSLPTTFFISADGIIQDVVVGGPLTLAGLQSRLDSLLEVTP